MFHSIRWRLVLSYLLVTLLTVSLLGVLALTLLRRYLSQQERTYLQASAEGLAAEALPLMQSSADPLELERLAQAAAFLGNVEVRILDAHKSELVGSGHASETVIWLTTSRRSDRSVPQLPWMPMMRGMPDEAVAVVVRRMEDRWGGRFVLSGHHEVQLDPTGMVSGELALQEPQVVASPAAARVVVTMPIGDADSPLGYVEVSQGQAMGEALRTARRVFLLAAAGALALAAIVGLGVSRWIAAPIRDLTDAAGRMAAGDLAVRAPVSGRDEIGQLGGQFNRMAEQVQASFTTLAAERDSLRRFIADASHELRTPITALSTFVELLRGGAADDPEARTEFFDESAVQVERLGWITSHLLDLARLDTGLAGLELAPCTAAALLEEAIAPFRLRAEEAGLSLLLEPVPPELTLVCDRERVLLALSNLVDNALKFTHSGGAVTLGVELLGERVRFWVRDTGPGIPAGERERVFERFYRGPGAAAGTPGSGLGLAIVRAVAQAHGGEASITGEPGEGSCFAIELPQHPTLQAEPASS